MDPTRARTTDPDEFIENAPEATRALAAELRDAFFRWEPDLTEAIKWNNLCFSGRKLICGLSPCKKHLSIVFFRGTELPDPAKLFTGGEDNTNIRNVRLTSRAELNLEALRRRRARCPARNPAHPAPPARALARPGFFHPGPENEPPRRRQFPQPLPELPARIPRLAHHRQARGNPRAPPRRNPARPQLRKKVDRPPRGLESRPESC